MPPYTRQNPLLRLLPILQDMQEPMPKRGNLGHTPQEMQFCGGSKD